MPVSRDIVLKLSMTLRCLSGAESLRDSLVSQLSAEWLASSPLAKVCWYEVTEVFQLPLIRNKQIEAVNECASVLFPAPELIGLLMDLNVSRSGFRHVSQFMPAGGGAHTAATRLPFSQPVPSCDRFTDTWKDLVKLLALHPLVSVTQPPTSVRSWPLQFWARYIQSPPPLVHTIDWKRPLTFLVRGYAYPCAAGSWIQLSIGLVDHGARAHTSAYLWVIGTDICGDKDMAALATMWSKKL